MDEISCLSDPIPIGGGFFEPIRWGDERRSSRWVIDFPCRDCRTPIGGVHHPGCCVERCPACLGQALGCPCFGDPEDDLDDLDDVSDRVSDDVSDRVSDDVSDRVSDHVSDRDVGSRCAGEDLADHVRISTRCRAHLFHRYFRR
jgi:hypothetical protein